MIRAEGERIAATADTLDQEKIQTQLQSLAERWTELLDKAGGRYVSSTVQGSASRSEVIQAIQLPYHVKREKGIIPQK